MKKQVDIGLILSNPNNPRIIKDHKFDKLVKSIKEFPQMLEKRPVVVDEAMMVLGGNMRLKACKEAGIKKVWVDVAEGWSDRQKDEFIIKDNVNFGQWDWEILANKWDSTYLEDWGIVPYDFNEGSVNEVNASDENEEWIGMPEFEKTDRAIKLIVGFETEEDREEYIEKHQVQVSSKNGLTWSTNYPFKEKLDLLTHKYE